LKQYSPKTAPLRVLIAEDHLIARLGVRAIITSQPDMQVVAEAINGEQAVALFREHRPDVMVADMRMPVKDGCEAVAEICREFPAARIVALSTFSGDQDVRRALAAGVKAYLSKGALYEELIEAIRAVHAGRQYMNPAVVAHLAGQPPCPDLSSRELDVLGLIVQGVTNKEIGYTLGIAEYTVKNHVKSILSKLGVDDRTRAATMAIQRGIVHLPD
jgi:two-component system NarL family response regulator